MNKIKRWFIFPYMFALIISFGHAIYTLINGQGNLAWWSVILSSGAMIGFFAYLGLSSVSATSRQLPLQLFAIAAAVVMALLDFDLLPSLYTLFIGGLASLLYILWYSSLSRPASDKLAVGGALPSFEFVDDKGQLIRNQDLLGAPVIYLFYRGAWCPLCVAQIKDLCMQYQELHDMGVKTVLISPQSQDDTRGLAKKFNVPFIFGFDKDLNAANALGIVHCDGSPLGLGSAAGADTVLPTVIITDAAGKILWTHQTDNYRIRPEPSLFLSILRDHQHQII